MAPKALLLSAFITIVVVFAQNEFAAGQNDKLTALPVLTAGKLPNDMRAGPNSFSKSVKIQLPDGPGKKEFERACTVCHASQQINRVNFGPDDWDHAVKTMVTWGAPLASGEIPTVVNYLSTNFDKKNLAPGVVVPGPVKVTVKEWDLPIRDSLPHDSLFDDGYLWVTQMAGQAIARFDVTTGTFKEYPMPSGVDPKAAVADKQGNIWITTDLDGVILRFDPRTGHISEYIPPGPKLELHDITIDHNGIVWFCVLHNRPPLYPDGSMIGRLDPSTGDIKLLDTPTPDSSPYGLTVDADGFIYYTTNESGRLGRVDPNTLKITEYPTPNPDSRLKRITITPDGIVWYTDRARGYLGRFDPKTHKFSEWPTPSGPKGYPYGISHVGNIIWYVEAESNPTMLVRFDPKTEKFQTWPIKDGGGMKHVEVAPDGSLWLTRALYGGIAHVTIEN
jgi:virginiamycin B lyase